MAYNINESERDRIRELYGLDRERNHLKESLAQCKFPRS